MPGISTTQPNAAFYIFPTIPTGSGNKYKDDKEFCSALMQDTGIVGVFGSGFGEGCDGHLRLVYLAEMEILKKAMDLMENFMRA